LTEWLQGINQGFLNLFDRAYGGKWNLVEQAIWCGLLTSPVVAAVLHRLAGATGGAWETAASLGYALLLVGFLAFAGGPMLGMLRIREFSIKNATRGILVGSLIGGIFGDIYVGFVRSLTGGLVGGYVGGISGGIGMGITSGLLAAIFVGIATVLGASVGHLIGAGLSAGIVYVFVAGITAGFDIGRIKIPVHPLKALSFSLLFLVLLGAAQWKASWAFIQAVVADPRVLAYVAFNVFADGVSLLETRWVLQRSATASLPALGGWLLLDLVASGIIYLILPTILWPQILDFWEAVRFQGEQPWLGLLFWTTFSTSFVFYAFVLAALLVRPLRALVLGFGGIGKLLNLEEHPVRCLSVAMALVVTVIFAGVGIWEIVSGFGAAPAAVP
jgi:hypothetical protein